VPKRLHAASYCRRRVAYGVGMESGLELSRKFGIRAKAIRVKARLARLQMMHENAQHGGAKQQFPGPALPSVANKALENQAAAKDGANRQHGIETKAVAQENVRHGERGQALP